MKYLGIRPNGARSTGATVLLSTARGLHFPRARMSYAAAHTHTHTVPYTSIGVCAIDTHLRHDICVQYESYDCLGMVTDHVSSSMVGQYTVFVERCSASTVALRVGCCNNPMHTNGYPMLWCDASPIYEQQTVWVGDSNESSTYCWPTRSLGVPRQPHHAQYHGMQQYYSSMLTKPNLSERKSGRGFKRIVFVGI